MLNLYCLFRLGFVQLMCALCPLIEFKLDYAVETIYFLIIFKKTFTCKSVRSKI